MDHGAIWRSLVLQRSPISAPWTVTEHLGTTRHYIEATWTAGTKITET